MGDIYVHPTGVPATTPPPDYDPGGPLLSDDQVKTAPAMTAPAPTSSPMSRAVVSPAHDPGGPLASDRDLGVETPPPKSSYKGSTWADVAKSAASGFGEGVEQLIGLPQDISNGINYGMDWASAHTAGALGLLPKGETVASTMDRLRSVREPYEVMPGSEQVHAFARDTLGIPDYQPQTTPGQYAKTVGSFLPGVAAFSPESSALGMAKNLIGYGVIPGVASESAGQMTKGTGLEPYARFAGALAPGAIMTGGTATGLGAVKFAQPFYSSGQTQRAANILGGFASDLPAARTTIADARANPSFPGAALGENVSGSKPTLGQLTGDPGLLGAERAVVTENSPLYGQNTFGTGAYQQNAARVSALRGIQPAGSPETISDAIRAQSQDIETQHNIAVQRAFNAAKMMAPNTTGQTPEALGMALRQPLSDARDAAKAKENALWNAIDPTGTLTLPSGAVAKTATGIAVNLPATAKPMGGEEAAIFQQAAELPKVAPFVDVRALASRIGDEQRSQLVANQGQPNATYNRLTQLRKTVENVVANGAPADAAARLQAARAASTARFAIDKGPMGPIITKGPAASDFRMPASSIPAKVFRSGPSGEQAAMAYAKTAGHAYLDPLRDTAVESLRREAMTPEGIIDPSKFASWQKKYSEALRVLPPQLRMKFSDAASATRAYEDATGARRVALDTFQKGALGKFLGLTAPEDVTKRVGSLFGSQGGIGQMHALRRSLFNDPVASEGLRKAVVDTIISRAIGTTEAGATGVNKINPSSFQKILRDNEGVIRAAGFSNDEINMMREIGADVQRSQRTLEATRLPGQSNTPQDLAKRLDKLAGAHPVSLFSKIAVGGFGGYEAHGVKGALLGAAGGGLEHIAQGLRNAGVKKSDELVRDALLDPELAAALLAKATPKTERHLGEIIAKSALFSALSSQRPQQGH